MRMHHMLLGGLGVKVMMMIIMIKMMMIMMLMMKVITLGLSPVAANTYGRPPLD